MDKHNFNKILKHYNFDQSDALILKNLNQIVSQHTKPFLKGFYEFIFEFEYAKMFIRNNEILKKHEKGIENWFLNLFCGDYDKYYFEKLHIISETHVNINLPPHYVNAAFSYVRRYVRDILIKEKKFDAISSFDKIIDINLDILTIVYREEEQTKMAEDIIFLKKCVENSDIKPFFQPIYDAKTLKISKYESLMRLLEPNTKKAVSVFPYLAIAKKIKLYKEMTYIMIEKSFNQLRDKDIEFSVNLCYEDIADINFKSFIIEKIESCPKPENIIFEIVETDFIEDFRIVEDFASSVREFGCKIAIDDFGSGFSSMENILKLKPEFIKIDGSLIKDIDSSKESKTIVKNIVNMARELNSHTVAEYVHSKEVLNIVKDLGVDYLQGFYLGEPKPF